MVNTAGVISVPISIQTIHLWIFYVLWPSIGHGFDYLLSIALILLTVSVGLKNWSYTMPSSSQSDSIIYSVFFVKFTCNVNHILLFCAGLIWRKEVAFKSFIISCASCSVFFIVLQVVSITNRSKLRMIIFLLVCRITPW